MSEGDLSRRVVVTGVGLHCGLGDLRETKESIAAGESAVRPVAPNRARGFPTSPGATADTRPLRGILSDRKLQKYMNPATQLAVIAASRALGDAGLLDDEDARREMALYMSTGLIAFDFSTIGRALSEAIGPDQRIDMEFVGARGLRLIHPLMPFKMLLNMPLGLVSIVFGIGGENAILYPGTKQAGAALEAAVRGIERGRFDRALVGGSEQGVAVMPLAFKKQRGWLADTVEGARPFHDEHQGSAVADMGAFLVIESARAAETRGARMLAEITSPTLTCPFEQGAAPEALLLTGSKSTEGEETLLRAFQIGETHSRPVVASLDGMIGHARSASLFSHLLFAADLVRGGELDRSITSPRTEGGNRGIESAAVAALEPEGSIWCGVKRYCNHVPVRGDRGRRVVITGMGVVSPIGIGREAYFDGLASSRSGIDVIRSFDATTYPTRVAGEVEGLDFEGIELPEDLAPALRRDPKSVFGVVAAREALDDAFGEGRDIPHGRSGRAVFLAGGLEIFHLNDLAAHLDDGDLDQGALLAAVLAAPADSMVQIPADIGARVIADELGAQGLRSLNLSACAAGTQALGEAYRAVADGVCDVALSGGYDSMINPLGVGGFCMLEALTRSNELGARASRPFDSRRDGFVLGEGAAMLVLENLDSARARGAEIYGEILGYASSLDAFRVSDPAPDQAGAIRAIKGALDDAGVMPTDIDYINAHGTGTRKNDPAETRAIRAVFGAAVERTPVSSTKSQIGHLIGAAGAVELCAGLFALREQLLPATITLQDPDPECDLDHVAIVPRRAEVRTFLSTSFGFGGQNAVIVVRRI